MACSGSTTNDEIKHRILNIYAKFVSDVEPDRLSDWLVQGEVITIDEKQRIRNTNHITSDRCRALLDHLFAIHHPRAFLIVREALSERNHHLLKYIDNQESECEFHEQPDTEASSKEEGDLKPKKRGKQGLLAEQSKEIDLLKKENMKLKQELEATKTDYSCRSYWIIGAVLSGLLVLFFLDYSYRPAGIICVDSIWRSFGNYEEYKDKPRYKSDPVLVQTIRTKAAEEGKKPTRGLTILDEELFVVSGTSSDVEVYDSIKLSFSRRWSLTELNNPFDIASCNRNKCLYIFDFKTDGRSSEILRIDPNGNLIKKWSIGDDYGRLSVTGESNVILTVYEKNKLNEYSPDGHLIREINLSSDAGIGHPLHAIKLSNGHFMVSHGYDDNDLHRVCLVDGDGKLKKSFGGKLGSTMEQMSYPLHLAIDGHGYVMVIELLNRRVLLLDQDFEFKREILSEENHGLRYPSRILLDESKGRVLVAENAYNSEKKKYTDGHILIFNFK